MRGHFLGLSASMCEYFWDLMKWGVPVCPCRVSFLPVAAASKFLLFDEWIICPCMHRPHLVSPVDGNECALQLLASVTRAAVDRSIQVAVRIPAFSSFRWMPWSGNARSGGNSTRNCLRNGPVPLHAPPQSHPQSGQCPVFPFLLFFLVAVSENTHPRGCEVVSRGGSDLHLPASCDGEQHFQSLSDSLKFLKPASLQRCPVQYNGYITLPKLINIK